MKRLFQLCAYLVPASHRENQPPSARTVVKVVAPLRASALNANCGGGSALVVMMRLLLLPLCHNARRLFPASVKTVIPVTSCYPVAVFVPISPPFGKSRNGGPCYKPNC